MKVSSTLIFFVFFVVGPTASVIKRAIEESGTFLLGIFYTFPNILSIFIDDNDDEDESSILSIKRPLQFQLDEYDSASSQEDNADETTENLKDGVEETSNIDEIASSSKMDSRIKHGNVNDHPQSSSHPESVGDEVINAVNRFKESLDTFISSGQYFEQPTPLSAQKSDTKEKGTSATILKILILLLLQTSVLIYHYPLHPLNYPILDFC